MHVKLSMNMQLMMR